jgi:hypothetical protein
VRKAARLRSRESVHERRGSHHSAGHRLEESRRSARNHRSAASHGRHFLVNARKATVNGRHGVIGATATSGLKAGRAKIGSAMRHGKTENREEIGPGRLARVRGRPARIASTVRRAIAVNREATGPIVGRLARVRGRLGRIASMASRAKAASREATAPIAGRLAAQGHGRLARSVSAGPIARVDLAAAVHRDSAIVRVRHAMAIGHAASIALRAIDRSRLREIGKDSVRRATAIAQVRLVKAANVNGPDRREARARLAAARLGHQAEPASDRRVAIAGIVRAVPVVVRAVGLDRAPKAAHRARRVAHGRRVTATVRLASGATTSRSHADTWSSTSSSSAPRRT